jgi:hypothetical protein
MLASAFYVCREVQVAVGKPLVGSLFCIGKCANVMLSFAAALKQFALSQARAFSSSQAE